MKTKSRTPKHRAGDPPLATLEDLFNDAWHLGRSWPGMAPVLERTCPCPKAECGLAVPVKDIPCDQHHGQKAIRQAHLASKCKKPKVFWKKS